MAKITGSVNLSGTITPYDSTDTYATHDQQYGRGGYRSVQNSAERIVIPLQRRAEGMLVFEIDTKRSYRLEGGIENTDWVEVNISTGNEDIKEW